MSLHGCRGRNVDRRALIGDGDDIVIADNDGGLRNIAANGDAAINGGGGRVRGLGENLDPRLRVTALQQHRKYR